LAVDSESRMTPQEAIVLELVAGETKTAIDMLSQTIADFKHVEQDLEAAERRAGLEATPHVSIIERMVRLGFSDRTLGVVGEMLSALDDIRHGRAIPQSALNVLRERRAARHSADHQLAAIAARRR
jgi:hypothetical protein